MYIAERLGYVDVDQMLDEITPRQFVEWQAYYTLGETNGSHR